MCVIVCLLGHRLPPRPSLLIVPTVGLILTLLAVLPAAGAPSGAMVPVAYLPYLTAPENTPTPVTPTPITPTPVTPTATAIPGDNVQCQQSGTTEICAWVSNGTPAQFSTVTVYGRLLVDAAGQSGQGMMATWHYKSTTPTCAGTTGVDGVANCARSIGGATLGYQVNVDVNIAGYQVTTWFIPQ